MPWGTDLRIAASATLRDPEGATLDGAALAEAIASVAARIATLGPLDLLLVSTTPTCASVVRLLAALHAGYDVLPLGRPSRVGLVLPPGAMRGTVAALIADEADPLAPHLTAAGIRMAPETALASVAGWRPPERPGSVLLQTSGTTGAPKAATLPMRGFAALLDQLATRLPLRPTDVLLSPLPVHHSYGLCNVLHALANGATLRLGLPMLTPDELAHDISTSGATVFAGVPTHYRLLERAPALADRGRGLRALWQAGDRMPVPLTRRLRELLPDASIYLMYGQTEASSRITILDPAKVDDKPDSVGTPLGSFQLTIRDARGVRLAVGQEGEICVSGPQVMAGYRNDPVATAQALGEHGLRTGDVGRLDADGDLYVTGRLAEFAKINGERVPARMIEQVIMRHPAVAQCVVQIGRMAERDDMLRALVIPAGSVDGADLPELRRDLLARLGRSWLPRIEMVARLPQTPSGKAIRFYDPRADQS
jgi:long-chain acyl-CoA synthetase